MIWNIFNSFLFRSLESEKHAWWIDFIPIHFRQQVLQLGENRFVLENKRPTRVNFSSIITSVFVHKSDNCKNNQKIINLIWCSESFLKNFLKLKFSVKTSMNITEKFRKRIFGIFLSDNYPSTGNVIYGNYIKWYITHLVILDRLKF